MLAAYRIIGFNGISDSWGTGLHVDHIKPRAEGGDNRQENLRTLCHPCHKQITAEWKRRKAMERKDKKRPWLKLTQKQEPEVD